MKIIVDTREQLPLWVGAKVIRRKLLVGDYSTVKLEDSFCIERKSLQDLYGSIIQGHIRFRKELVRARVSKVKLVLYVEGCKKDFIAKKFPRGSERKIPGEVLGKIIDTIAKRHNIEVVWCVNRASLISRVNARLKREEKLHFAKASKKVPSTNASNSR